jgi:hypothetical protein
VFACTTGPSKLLLFTTLRCRRSANRSYAFRHDGEMLAATRSKPVTD